MIMIVVTIITMMMMMMMVMTTIMTALIGVFLFFFFHSLGYTLSPSGTVMWQQYSRATLEEPRGAKGKLSH